MSWNESEVSVFVVCGGLLAQMSYVVSIGEKKKKTKKGNPWAKLILPFGQARRVMQVEKILQVENINPPHQKLRIEQVNPADPTYIAISSYSFEPWLDPPQIYKTLLT